MAAIKSLLLFLPVLEHYHTIIITSRPALKSYLQIMKFWMVGEAGTKNQKQPKTEQMLVSIDRILQDQGNRLLKRWDSPQVQTGGGSKSSLLMVKRYVFNMVEQESFKAI